uniref:Uncharacterized protein n=1 Tax=mine drainage metagenome TaxID=410659 RepID=E6Q3D2_9ZZZZ
MAGADADEQHLSLCHDDRIALFGYPGVGLRTMGGSVTRDAIASDVDAMLNDASVRYGISTNVVDPVGWSLGTTNAEKFTVLSLVSRPTRTIHNVILIGQTQLQSETTSGCTAFGTIKISLQNGGVCPTDTSDPDLPVASACARLRITERLTVIN